MIEPLGRARIHAIGVREPGERSLAPPPCAWAGLAGFGRGPLAGVGWDQRAESGPPPSPTETGIRGPGRQNLQPHSGCPGPSKARVGRSWSAKIGITERGNDRATSAQSQLPGRQAAAFVRPRRWLVLSGCPLWHQAGGLKGSTLPGHCRKSLALWSLKRWAFLTAVQGWQGHSRERTLLGGHSTVAWDTRSWHNRTCLEVPTALLPHRGSFMKQLPYSSPKHFRGSSGN